MVVTYKVDYRKRMMKPKKNYSFHLIVSLLVIFSFVFFMLKNSDVKKGNIMGAATGLPINTSEPTSWLIIAAIVLGLGIVIILIISVFKKKPKKMNKPINPSIQGFKPVPIKKPAQNPLQQSPNEPSDDEINELEKNFVPDEPAQTPVQLKKQIEPQRLDAEKTTMIYPRDELKKKVDTENTDIDEEDEENEKELEKISGDTSENEEEKGTDSNKQNKTDNDKENQEQEEEQNEEQEIVVEKDKTPVSRPRVVKKTTKSNKPSKKPIKKITKKPIKVKRSIIKSSSKHIATSKQIKEKSKEKFTPKRQEDIIIPVEDDSLTEQEIEKPAKTKEKPKKSKASDDSYDMFKDLSEISPDDEVVVEKD